MKDLRLGKGRDLPITHSRGGRLGTQKPDLWSAWGPRSQGSRPASWCPEAAWGPTSLVGWRDSAGEPAGTDPGVRLGQESEGIFITAQCHTRRGGTPTFHPRHQSPAHFPQPGGDQKHRQAAPHIPAACVGTTCPGQGLGAGTAGPLGSQTRDSSTLSRTAGTHAGRVRGSPGYLPTAAEYTGKGLLKPELIPTKSRRSIGLRRLLDFDTLEGGRCGRAPSTLSVRQGEAEVGRCRKGRCACERRPEAGRLLWGGPRRRRCSPTSGVAAPHRPRRGRPRLG